MKVLLCHNYYQVPGGEDQSFAAEGALLETRGHETIRFEAHNDSIKGMNLLAVACKTFFNRDIYRKVRHIIRAERPTLMHCTNTFPLISPAIYYAARAENLPVVQSLRNYRQFCLNSFFLREQQVCEVCMHKLVPWPGILHRCYQGNAAGSAVVAGMIGTHKLLGTWRKTVDQYFTLTKFARTRFIAAGWPAESIAVKPNFIDPDPGPGEGDRNYAVFVGRLSIEKGIRTLLEAWRTLPAQMRLKIIGTGPLAEEVAEFCHRYPNVELAGQLSHAEVLSAIGQAAFLVMPSIWYETFGRTIIEAYAKQTPVIASRIGALAEVVAHGKTGYLFNPGNPDDLAAKVRQMWSEDSSRREMGMNARAVYVKNYTAEPNYQMLMQIYDQAILTHSARSRGRPSVSAR